MNRKSLSKSEQRGQFSSLLKITRLPWLLLVGTCLVCILDTVLILILPDISSRLLSGDFSDETLKTMIWVLGVSAFVLAFRQYLLTIAQGQVTLAFRKSVFGKILRLKSDYFEKNPSGTLISRATMDTTMLSDFIVGAICYIPSLLYTFVGTFVIIFGYDWRLVVLEGVLVPILLLITWLNGRLQFKWYNRIQGKLSVLSSFLAERLVNIPLMKLFVKEEYEQKQGLDTVDALYTTQKKYAFRFAGIQYLLEFEGVVQSVVIVVGGAAFVHLGYIDLQEWIAFYLYAGGLIGSVQQLLDYWNRYKQMTGSAKRISEIAEAPVEGVGGDQELPQESRDITFSHVSYGYTDGPEVLHNVNLTIPGGKKTVIIGKSGAGKTTMLYLLERFFQPSSGEILYGDTDVSQYTFDSWRSGIGYVSQSANLFSGTIRDNVLYGIKRDVSDTEIEAALKKAQLWDFIQSSRDGLDTFVGENGCKLSGGQRQRVVIARLFLSNPQIVLLDEATSSLDAEAVAAVNQCFDALGENRTMIIVSHALKECDRADNILVMDEGRVDAFGSREEIMAHNAIYQSLKQMQANREVENHD